MTKTCYIKGWMTLLFIWAFIISGSAQQIDATFWNPTMSKIAKPSSTWGWVKLQDDNDITPNNLFTTYREAFQLSPNDEMVLIKKETDRLGFTHYTYQQYYKDIPVNGGLIKLHLTSENHAYMINGTTVLDLDIEADPLLPEDIACTIACRYADGNGFLWLDRHAEAWLKRTENDPKATFFPQGKLIIQQIEVGRDQRPTNYALAWEIDIRMGFSGESRKIYIDAYEGWYLNHYAISMTCSAGTGTTTWEDEQNINTFDDGSNFILLDDCLSYDIKTWNLQRDSFSTSQIDYTDGDNDWTAMNDRSGVQCHFGARMTRDYFNNVHARTSWDGGTADYISYNEAIIFATHNNACFDCFPNIAAFGGGNSANNPNDDWNTLDIVGHEFTHGVTKTSAGLQYLNESGALNESFSDIFGEMIERFTRDSLDWLVGGDRGAIRSMANPNAFNDPDTYSGTNWCNYQDTSLNCTKFDAGGVHTNSGVQNYWFYLLAVGGTGTNDNGDDFEVTGIGIDKAAAIAYRNLNTYLGNTSDYTDAREGALQAARDLFGECSEEEIQCGKAWFAVGVGTGLTEYDLQMCGLITSGYHRGINSVVAGGACNTTVQAFSDDVTFAGGNEVLLQADMEAEVSGSQYFLATLDDCSFTARQAFDDLYPPENLIYHGAVDIEEQLAIQAKVFPNPSDGYATVHYTLPVDGDVEIQLYNLNGRLIRTFQVDPKEKGDHFYQIKTPFLPSGIYYCKVISGSLATTLKWVIQR